ncbi:hypothetical protein C2G38_2197189 [Gigaspora rosea]|uniref:Uncharacterized protein n=1 Tax=Gigaspora rosea TaxID=44941 RepID=A0A397UTX2_9GLOM|nr:hypothetical protein C2G38_2197189 [Gigaspora rosea]
MRIIPPPCPPDAELQSTAKLTDTNDFVNALADRSIYRDDKYITSRKRVTLQGIKNDRTETYPSLYG